MHLVLLVHIVGFSFSSSGLFSRGPQWAVLVEAKARNSELLGDGSHGSGAQALRSPWFYCLPGHMKWKLNWKWSSLDWNWKPHGIPVVKVKV